MRFWERIGIGGLKRYRRVGFFALVLAWFLVWDLPGLSAIYTGGPDDGFSDSQGSNYDVVRIESSSAQIVYKDDGTGSTALNDICITQETTASGSSTAPINPTNDIRIVIPSTMSLTWDTSVTSLSASGTAVDNSKISSTPSVSYEQDGTGNYRIAVIQVDADFADGEYVILSGLKVTNATTVGYDYLRLDISGGSGAIARDVKRILVQYPKQAGYTGGGDDGFDVAVGATTDLVWIDSARAQIFYKDDSSSPIQPITVWVEKNADPSNPAVNATDDIRIKIPSTISAVWDTTDTTATVTGSASSKVSTTVSYEDSGKTLVIDVISDFEDGDTITISDLSMTNFTSVGWDKLELEVDNAGTTISEDTKRTLIQYPNQAGYTGGSDDGFDVMTRTWPVTLYRSVGTNAGDLNTVSATVQITSDGVTTTATFSSPLPDDIGPGDVLQWYDSGSSSYKIAFVVRRITSTQFEVQSADGGLADTAPAGTAVSIYRAYTSLNDFNLQDENDSLDDSVEDFDTTKDLVSNGLGYEVVCYADGVDTANATISGWSTSASTYILVRARSGHDGVFGSNYTLQPTTGTALTIQSDHVRIEGLSISSPDSDAISVSSLGANADVRLYRNIIRGNAATSTHGISVGDVGASARVIVYDNIVYDFTGTGASAIYWNDTNANLTMIVYNNTLKDCSRGLERGSDSVEYVKNNIVDTTDAFYGTFPDDDTYNDYNFISENNSSEVAIGTHGGYNLTFSYEDESSDNFKLASSDTSAKDKGADLSSDSVFAFSEDIDGQGRGNGDGWDAGADEVTINQYRSVGPTTTDLNTGSATVTISGTTATFSAAMPNDIGIGDVLQYDGDGDTNMDIAIITARQSPTQFTVTTPNGGTPVSAPAGTSVSIYRAYTSLENAANLNENDSLDDTIEDFDTESNLITRNTILHLVCYGDASNSDTTPATIDFTTDSANYVKIYTPYHDTEVGTSQRHWGKWDSTKYNLSVSGAVALTVDTYKAEVDGLQVSASQMDSKAIVITSNCRDVTISRSIIKGDYDGSSGSNVVGISATIPEGTLKIYDDIVYNCDGDSGAKGIYLDINDGTAYVYSNTLYHTYTGISVSSGTVVAKNNIVQSATDGYSGTFDSSSDYNLSNLDSDAPNATYTAGNSAVTVSFVDTTAGSEDLHLSSSDSAAKDNGTDLSSDSNLAFHKDIDSLSRYDGSWDIGADEESNNGYVVWDGGGADNSWSTAENWSNDTVPDSTTKVFFDDWSVKDSTWDASGPAQINTIKVMSDYTGTLSLGRDVQVSNDWAYYGSNFDAGTYTLEFSGTDNHSTFTPGSVSYYNLKFSKSNFDMIINGTATVSNDLILNSYGSGAEIKTGEIDVYGDINVLVNVSGGGDALIKLVGSGDQTINSNGGALPNVEVDKPGGTLYLVGTIRVSRNWTWTNGSLDAGTSTLEFTESDYVNSLFVTGNVTYWNIVDNKGDSAIIQQGDLVVSNLFYIQYGDYQTNSYDILCAKFVMEGSGSTFTAGSSRIVIRGGDFVHSAGTFNAGTSTVVLEGGDQQITGSTSFYNLIKHCGSSSCKLIFDAGATTTVTNLLQLSGRPERPIELRSTTEGSQYTIDASGTAQIEYADIKDASFATAVTAAASTDSGNNTGLTVTREFVCDIRASGGDYTDLSSWASAVACDLTASTTKVFGHSGIVGSIPDGASVSGATSGATGTVVHCTDDQILIKDITGTFQSGEQVQVDSSNYVVITDSGTGAVAAAYIYDDWPSGLNDAVSISSTSWTTDADNFVSIYAPISQRHSGKVKEGSNYSGPALIGSGTQINISAPYTRVEGLIFDDPDDATTAIEISADHTKIIGNLFHGFNTGYYGINVGANADQDIQNNILINSDVNISDSATGNIYIYDNTVYQGQIKAGTSGKVIAKNNLAYNDSASPYTGTYASASDYNLSNDASAPGTHSLTNKTLTEIAFKDTTAGSEDLHIWRYSVARNQGTDLAGETVAWVVDDIDRDNRSGLSYPDMGADEAEGVIKKRSVGITATALATDDSGANSLTISSNTATFSSGLPNNVGVGDIIQYDSDGDSSVDALAVIVSRQSSTQYGVIATDGESTATEVTNSTTWQIYRAYTSLASWASQSQNSNITVGTLDSSKDLVTDEAIAEAICYADGADTSSVTISGWTTDPMHYIHIYTPTSTSEVGSSQRHSGTYSSGGYALEVTNSNGLVLASNDVVIDGLKFSVTQDDGNSYSALQITADAPNITVKNSIFKSSNADNLIGIDCQSGTGGEIFVYNDVFHDFAGANSYAMKFSTTSEVYLYNNTVYNVATGIDAGSSGTVVAKNDIVQSATDGYSGTFDSSSDHNISNIYDDAPNASFTPGVATLQFSDSAGRDFDVKGWPDWAVIDKGEDLSNQLLLSFNTDILGRARESGKWDIGAFEYQPATITSTADGNWFDPSTWDAGYIPTPKDDVVVNSDVTYRIGNLLFDDFEEGGFTGWTYGGTSETGNSITFVTSPVYSGNYAVKYTFGGTADSNELWKKRSWDPSKVEYYIRLYFYLDSESLSDGKETSVFELTGSEVSGRLSVYKSGVSLYLKAYYYDDSQGLVAFPNMAPIKTGRWYAVEFYQKADGSGSGEARFWVDGALIDSATSLTNSGGYIRNFYLGQLNGTNDEAITYVVDDVAIDSTYRPHPRPTESVDSTKPYTYDYTIKSLTVNAGHSLSSEEINSTIYQQLWVYGDVSVSGTLSLFNPFKLLIKSDTALQHGITVNSGGSFVTDGYLRSDQRLVIAPLTQDGSHNTYIHCTDGSTCRFSFTKFSHLGGNSANEYGITAQNLDPSSASEGVVVQFSEISDSYIPIRLENCSNAFIYGNRIHDSTYGIYLSSSNRNLLSHDDIYGIANTGISLVDSSYNGLYANLLYSLPTGISLTGTSSYNRIYNQTVSTATGVGIQIADASQDSNQIKNGIIHSCATGISDSGTGTVIDHNLFYDNTSDGSTGTNATTGVDPGFISTSPADTTFFYLSKNSPALGAGIDLFSGSSPGTVNLGARLGYVKNVTDNNVFNYMNGASSDVDTSSGDTITTYANDVLQSSFAGDGTALGAGLVRIAVPDTVVTADGDLVGDYIFVEAGQNYGYFYPIVASDEDTTDTITIYSPDHPANTFHTNDKFTVVDRVYGWVRNEGHKTSAVLWISGYAKFDNTVWDVNGRVIVFGVDTSMGVYVGYTPDGVRYVTLDRFVFNGLPKGISLGETLGGWYAWTVSPALNEVLLVNCGIGVGMGHTGENGTDNTRASQGSLLEANMFRDNAYGISGGDYIDRSTFLNNMFVENTSCGFYSIYFAKFLLFEGNYFFGNNEGYADRWHNEHARIVRNTFLGNTKGVVWKWTAPNYAYNNNFIANTYGISYGEKLSSSNQVRNNIFAYNVNGASNGEGGSYSLSEDFNYYYNNTTDYYDTIGSNSISGSSDPFEYTSLGTADAASTTTMIYIPGADWTDNQWQKWGVKVVDTSTGDVYWAGVYSSTKDRLYLAPALSVEPDGLQVYITDFRVAKDAEVLGQGCDADGSTEPGTVNMGARLGFVKNETDGTKFNYIEQAAEDSGLSAGDVVKIYGIEESSGVVGAVEDQGPFAKITLYHSTEPDSEGTITADDQYDGMYIYFTSGLEKGKYYLITDCAEMSTADGDDTDDDHIIILCDDPSHINTGDSFVIVDRVYDEARADLAGQSAQAVLTVSGTADAPITWQAGGRAILDADGMEYGLAINGASHQVIEDLDIQNSQSYAIYTTGSPSGIKISDNWIHHSQKGIGNELIDSVIEGNELWGISSNAIELGSGSSRVTIENNRIWTEDQALNITASASTIADNQLLKTKLVLNGVSNASLIRNFLYGQAIELTGTGSGNRLWNNTVYKSQTDGIYLGASQTGNQLRNNMLVDNAQAGIDDDDTTGSNDIDYDLYKGNLAVYEGSASRGSNEVELTSLSLKERASGTVGAGSSDLVIVDASKSWGTDGYKGMIVKVVDGSSNEYYAPILSNSDKRLYLASSLGYSPVGDGSESYYIYDLSVEGTSDSDTNTSLGQGCRADGVTKPGTVNIGYITDLSKNVTDGLKFNSMQDAHDDASLGPGDTVTTYAVNEVENATIGSTVTDLGPMVKLDVSDDSVITQDGQYEGMYLYIEAGENLGKYYLIVDTDEDGNGTTDTITIATDDDASSFREGDVFTIVDRVYRRWGSDIYADPYHYTPILAMSKAGMADNPINWNASGRVILDADSLNHSFFMGDADYQVISDFVFKGNSDSVIRVHHYGGMPDHVKFVRNKLYNTHGLMSCVACYSGWPSFWLVKDNHVHRGSCGYGAGLTGYAVLDNIITDYGGAGINLAGSLIKGNKIFHIRKTGYGLHNSGACIVGAGDNVTIKENVALKGTSRGGVYCYSADNNLITNNVLIANSFGSYYGGIYLYNSNNNRCTNNILVDNSNGILDEGTDNTYDFNYYYGNSNAVSNGTPGPHSITGYDPNFTVNESGTVGTGTTTTVIVDTSKSWTPNQWQGYGIKVTVGGTDYWAGIYSNTADKLYITPALGASPTAGTDTYIITDFSIQPTSSDNTPLGQGCSADGSTEPGDVNMGTHLEFALLDGTKYNSLNSALSSASAGFNILVGSRVYVESGTISSATDEGPMVQLSVSDVIPEDNAYEGMYLVVKTGAHAHKAYLIVDTQDDTTDTITILCDDASGFSNGDLFDIVDRIYNDGVVNKAVDLVQGGSASSQAMIAPYDTSMLWYAGSEDYEDLIDYAIYDDVVGGCECTELKNLYPVNYQTLYGGTNSPRYVPFSYYYPCSALYMDLLMRVRNYFRAEGDLIKWGITED